MNTDVQLIVKINLDQSAKITLPIKYEKNSKDGIVFPSRILNKRPPNPSPHTHATADE